MPDYFADLAQAISVELHRNVAVRPQGGMLYAYVEGWRPVVLPGLPSVAGRVNAWHRECIVKVAAMEQYVKETRKSQE